VLFTDEAYVNGAINRDSPLLKIRNQEIELLGEFYAITYGKTSENRNFVPSRLASKKPDNYVAALCGDFYCIDL
jgi:hypothetical protein